MANYKSKLCIDCGVGFLPTAPPQKRCPPCQKAYALKYARDWRRRNPERSKSIKRKWEDANQDKRKAAKKVKYESNKEYQRLWRKANKNKLNSRRRELRAADSIKSGLDNTRYRHERRARESNAVCQHGKGCWHFGIQHMPMVCAWCGSNYDIVADHWHPVRYGGLYCRFNLQPLCHSCNLSKGARLIFPKVTLL